MANLKELPVYLFTGFLEAGKTKFIQETLEDKRFCNGERTLLLVCEEGEERFEDDLLNRTKTIAVFFENKEGSAFKYYHTPMDDLNTVKYDSYIPLFNLVKDFVLSL